MPQQLGKLRGGLAPRYEIEREIGRDGWPPSTALARILIQSGEGETALRMIEPLLTANAS